MPLGALPESPTLRKQSLGLQHEETLAPSLEPWGNATEANGANQQEPSRGSCPAPTDVALVAPEDVTEAHEAEITRDQMKTDRRRAQVALQPQPSVNTKAQEATSLAAQSRPDMKAPPTSNNAHLGAAQRLESVRGSIDEYSSPYRAASIDSTTDTGSVIDLRGGSGHKRLTKDDLEEIQIAPDSLQPTVQGRGGGIRDGFKLAGDSKEAKDLAFGSVATDEEDPDAIYRLASDIDPPFSVGSTSVRLTKQERLAEKQEARLRRKQKLVRDPVTGRDIWIENARGSSRKILAHDGVVAPVDGAVRQQSERSAADIIAQLHKVPFKDDKTNLLFYPMNPPEWRELLSQSQEAIFQWGYILIFGLVTVQVVMSPFPTVYSLWINCFFGIISIIFVRRKIEANFQSSFLEAERVRGEHATLAAVPESVEWLNNIVRTIWPTINSELFAGPIDLLEDILQKQVPSVVHTVKVSDLDIGSVPLRIMSMRFLSDDRAPRGDEDATGEYVNLEVSFAYRAGKTDKSLQSKAKNIHLLIWFLVGLRNVLGIPIPIWVEVLGIIGKARVRVQLLPDPPFLKNGTITLMGMPKIELSTIPISTYFFNVMNLPFVSQLVSFAVKTMCKDLIAPRSYTLDISKLMVGDDVKKETASIGILMICLHGAIDVPRADHRPGRSKVDPYATVQYSQFGRTLYYTRVIQQDYNPVWEETCFIPILPAVVKAAEKMRINLWDSDRLSADDLLGRVEVDLVTLVKNPGSFERRIDRVVGTPHTKLHWSIGFFGKRKIADQEIPSVVDSRVPVELRNHPDFQVPEPTWSVESKSEKLICRTPPDKNYPGILSIQIHQIRDLGVVNPKAAMHDRHGRVLADEAVEQGKEDDSGSAPSSYCTVSLNDELVYKTRTRAYTNRPIFNASFERFVRSFSDTHIRITVRDQRFREADPILGILALAVREELDCQGQVTRWYPLAEGIGFGHIRVSLLYRNVDCQIPSTLQGWNVGTLHIYGIRAIVGEEDAEALKDCSMRIDTSLGHKTIGAVHSNKSADGSVTWDLGTALVMPIRRRHATSLNLEAHRGGVPFTKKGLFSGIYGASIIALSALEDGHRDRVQIPIFQADDYVRFKQNSLVQDSRDQDRALRRLGHIEVDCVLISGLSESHRRFAKRSNDLAQTHEAWETEVSLRKRLAYDARRDPKQAVVRKSTTQQQDKQPATDSMAQVSSSSSSSSCQAEPASSSASNNNNITFSIDQRTRDPGPDLAAIPETEEADAWSSDTASIQTNKSHRSLATWLADKKEQRRERHRRHRGIMQQKPARTVSWMKRGLRMGISKAGRALSLNRDYDLVEREF